MGKCVSCISPSDGQPGVISWVRLVLAGLLQFLNQSINGLSPPKLAHNPAPVALGMSVFERMSPDQRGVGGHRAPAPESPPARP